jgi:hypothetical protein
MQLSNAFENCERLMELFYGFYFIIRSVNVKTKSFFRYEIIILFALVDITFKLFIYFFFPSRHYLKIV